MSKMTDYLELFHVMWDIERFSRWDPREHWSLAYVIDGAYEAPDYKEQYNRWMALAKNQDFDELAWSLVLAQLKICETDARITEETMGSLRAAENYLGACYKDQAMCLFGIMQEAYAPDWFFPFYHVYMDIEKLKRENAVVDYAIQECAMSPKIAQETYEKLAKHVDILNEFYFYISYKRFKEVYPVTVHKISAKQLTETTYLSVMGAYMYLIYLRDHPDEALKDLKRGLPRK